MICKRKIKKLTKSILYDNLKFKMENKDVKWMDNNFWAEVP